MGKPLGADIDEDLQLLDARFKQLRREYEQYFLGQRPREPRVLRGEVQRIVTYWSNMHIPNTANRFRFNNMMARFFTFRQKWDLTQRKIEDGTYERDVFKANLHDSQRSGARPPAASGATAPAQKVDDVFNAYKEACQATGKDLSGVDQQKFATAMSRQEKAIREKYGCDSVKFRVVVKDGKATLKASPIR